ncbi:MAG: prephenate dehydrogenase [Flavobacteriales bacterium]|nr:prephenate dehydrogenase [Flavobacteriales bacterium]MCB9335024.1 prephenate dehydrogenase [Flavobacteriales bacterium]
MKTIGIIGLGLIGGSLGLTMKKSKDFKVIGFDLNPKNAQKALELGLVDNITEKEALLKEADIIIVATPTKASISVLKEALSQIESHQILIDMGSTKSKICEALKNHPNRKNFVASHPIAGTENSGPESAIEHLFENKKMVICNETESDKKAINTAKGIFKTLKCEVVYMDANEHDKHLAYISHLSHICSFALGLTVLDLEKDEENIFNLAGSGFSSTARLAKSSPEMWESISIQNKTHLLSAISAYMNHLSNLKEIIELEQSTELINEMKKANEIRRIIKN